MPEAHLRLLGSLLQTIGPLIETADQSLRDGIAELDSFDDLATVGPLDRLIISELLWLKLNPNEFVRRVAEREALRRRPEYRDRAEQRAVLLVVDSGVDMLGRLRLLSLAGLLAIGAAAHRRGARFIWTSTGLTGEPIWIDGLTRRGLSRFVRQTGLDGLNGQVFEHAMATAPNDAAGSLVWTIGRKGAAPAEVNPDFRLELSDTRVDVVAGDDPPQRTQHRTAEATVIAKSGGRRRATLQFPDESTAAELLRAPFQPKRAKTETQAPTDWSAAWIVAETDEAALYLRQDDHVMLLRHGEPFLSARLPGDSMLLGARLRLSGPSIMVWRRADDVHVARFMSDGEFLSRGAAQLSADHPLLTDSESEREGALPTLMRHGRRVGAVFAGPDGRLYSALTVGADERTLSVERVDHLRHLRVLARAKAWLLARSETVSGDALILTHVRKGGQRALQFDDDATQSVRDCALIGDRGGALLATAAGWRWAPPRGFFVEAHLHPPVAQSAMLLQVDAPYHALQWRPSGSGKKSPLEYNWSAWFWTPKEGLRRFEYSGTNWREHPARSPEIEGTVLAMKRLGQKVYAVSDIGGGERTLFEFEFNSSAPARRKDSANIASPAQGVPRCVLL